MATLPSYYHIRHSDRIACGALDFRSGVSAALHVAAPPGVRVSDAKSPAAVS